MADDCLLYYITDRTAFAPDEPTRRHCLMEKIAEAARAGVDYIQLREKDLSTRELESLAHEAVGVLNQLRTEKRELKTALLINSRTDIAIATDADGVHLRSDDICASDVRRLWNSCSGDKQGEPLIGVSCHSLAEVVQAHAGGATFAVFAPVLALGGVTLENARSCLDAGASGIAAIRLFQENDIAEIVHELGPSSR